MRVYLNNKKRHAISPVLATVILIAITLIAAIAVAGFVFGLFGSFTSSATVQVTYESVSHLLTSGTINAQNTGTSNTNLNSLTLTYGGATCAPTYTVTNPLTAGATTAITVTGLGTCAAAGTAGEAFTGMLFLSNGGQIPFSGMFS